MIAADVYDVDIRALKLRYEGSVVLFARGIGFVDGFLAACGIQSLASFVSQAFAIGALVVEDGDDLAGESLGKIIAGHDALLVVTAADAENTGSRALIGEGRVSRSGGDLDQVFLGIDGGGRNRRSRTEMARHENHFLRCKVIGNGNGLLWVASI